MQHSDCAALCGQKQDLFSRCSSHNEKKNAGAAELLNNMQRQSEQNGLFSDFCHEVQLPARVLGENVPSGY